MVAATEDRWSIFEVLGPAATVMETGSESPFPPAIPCLPEAILPPYRFDWTKIIFSENHPRGLSIGPRQKKKSGQNLSLETKNLHQILH